MQDLIDCLKQTVNDPSVLETQDISDKYHADWSGASPCAPIALLKPKTPQQLSQIMTLCHQFEQPVVVQGGLTGLSGGATPQRGEMAISLERMTGIEEIDGTEMTLTALAGTPLQLLQDAALEKNLFLPLDLASRGSCTIGGNLATNAGGTEVIRYGMARSMVLGLEAVLADGSLISSMNKMVKNNSGYDLKQLFIGTEGTLGIISRVVIQLQPKALRSHTALCALKSYQDVMALLVALKHSLGSGLTGFELMWDNYFDKVLQTIPSLQSPFNQSHPFYLLVEYKDSDKISAADYFESVLFSELEAGIVQDAVIAQSHQDAAKFWQIRDGISEILPILGPISNQDISLPTTEIETFTLHMQQTLEKKYNNLNMLMFGHLGDNNLHVCAYTGREDDKASIDNDIMQMIGQFGGAITAEHGVGVTKKDFLSLSRSSNEIALMKTIKSALDPKGILNPGRIF